MILACLWIHVADRYAAEDLCDMAEATGVQGHSELGWGRHNYLLHVLMNPERRRMLSLAPGYSWQQACTARLLFFFFTAATITVMGTIFMMGSHQDWLLGYAGSMCWPCTDVTLSRQHHIHGISCTVLLKYQRAYVNLVMLSRSIIAGQCWPVTVFGYHSAQYHTSTHATQPCSKCKTPFSQHRTYWLHSIQAMCECKRVTCSPVKLCSSCSSWEGRTGTQLKYARSVAALQVQPGSWVRCSCACNHPAWSVTHDNTDAGGHIQRTGCMCVMTWWQVYMGHAGSQLLAQLGW